MNAPMAACCTHHSGELTGREAIFISPTGAVAKYCDEYVCVCASVCLLSVCLSARISPEPQSDLC